jgi:hypothetical protein
MHCSKVTADFEFNLPVRFDTDHMAVTIESFKLSLDDVQRLLPAHNLRV